MTRLRQIAKQFAEDGHSVTFPVAQMIFRKLSGFAGYPQEKTGEDHFVEEFRKVCASVEHAEEIIRRFDGKFPTLKEIRDTAVNLRPGKSLLEERREWERQYGKPEPFKPEVLATRPDEISRADLDTINREIARKLDVPFHRLNTVSNHAYYRTWRDLGYPLTSAQREYI